MEAKAGEMYEEGSLAKKSEPPMRGSPAMLLSGSLRPLLLRVRIMLEIRCAVILDYNLQNNSALKK